MEMAVKLFLCFLVNLPLVFGAETEYPDLAKEVLKKMLKDSEDNRHFRPPFYDSATNTSKPVEVHANMFVRSMSRIDHNSNEYDMQLTFRQMWTDPRLAFDSHEGKVQSITTASDVKRFWTPDIFFANEKHGKFHNVMVPNSFLRISSDGSVIYSARISLTLSCPMDLRRFPFDTQICSIRIASYGYTTEDVELVWKVGDPVQISKILISKEFSLENSEVDTCTSRTSTGEYGCLLANFTLKRVSFTYFFHVYLPIVIYVLASWVSFWLKPESVFPRFTIAIGSTVCTLLHLYSINSLLIIRTYFTALDIWVGVSFLCILAGIAENLYVNYVYVKTINAISSTEDEGGEGKNRTEIATFKFLWAKASSETPKIDVISRVCFPLIFGGVNVIYWPLLV